MVCEKLSESCINPISLRVAKTPYSFGHSECNRARALAQPLLHIMQSGQCMHIFIQYIIHEMWRFYSVNTHCLNYQNFSFCGCGFLGWKNKIKFLLLSI